MYRAVTSITRSQWAVAETNFPPDEERATPDEAQAMRTQNMTGRVTRNGEDRNQDASCSRQYPIEHGERQG